MESILAHRHSGYYICQRSERCGRSDRSLLSGTVKVYSRTNHCYVHNSCSSMHHQLSRERVEGLHTPTTGEEKTRPRVLPAREIPPLNFDWCGCYGIKSWYRNSCWATSSASFTLFEGQASFSSTHRSHDRLQTTQVTYNCVIIVFTIFFSSLLLLTILF